jgi:glycosyltransferase involved in cell wall biosynthesis
VGAYRWAKLSSHLAALGHPVHVLSMDWRHMPHQDWCDEVHRAGIQVHTAPSRYPHNLKYRRLGHRILDQARDAAFVLLERTFKIADEAQFWGPAMLPVASELIRSHGIRVVIATGPPFSNLRYAAELKTRTGQLRSIYDFRDPWEASPNPALMAQRAETLAMADCVVAVTPEMARFHSELCPQAQSLTIPNGFDPNSFAAFSGQQTKDLDFVYVGSLYKRETEFKQFAEWMRSWTKSGKPLRCTIIGRVSDRVTWACKDLVTANHLQFIDTVPQRQALESLAKARFALHLNSPANETQMATKVFEHAALRVPTVSLNYGGATAEFIDQRNIGYSIDLRQGSPNAALDRIMTDVAAFRFDLTGCSYPEIALQYSEQIEQLARR